VLASDRRSDSK